MALYPAAMPSRRACFASGPFDWECSYSIGACVCVLLYSSFSLYATFAASPLTACRVLQDGHDRRFAQIRVDPARFSVVWTMQAVWNMLAPFPLYLLLMRNAPGTVAVASIVANLRALPQRFADAFVRAPDELDLMDSVLLALWVASFLLQIVADGQKCGTPNSPLRHLDDSWHLERITVCTRSCSHRACVVLCRRAFRRQPENRGRFIASGVWSWSRHPNYFAQMMLSFLLGIWCLRGLPWTAVPGVCLCVDDWAVPAHEIS